MSNKSGDNGELNILAQSFGDLSISSVVFDVATNVTSDHKEVTPSSDRGEEQRSRVSHKTDEFVRVERGRRAFTVQGDLGMLTESSFGWGLALRPCDWSAIIVAEHDWERERHTPLSGPLLHRLKNYLVPVAERNLVSRLALCRVVLLSGSWIYLEPWAKTLTKLGIPALLLIDSWSHTAKPKPIQAVDWYRVRHAVVGGASSGRVWVGSLGLPRFKLPVSVERRLLQVVDQSLKPGKWVRSSETPYQLEDRARLNRLDLPVIHSTFWLSTGVVTRLLSQGELAAILDLPSWVVKDTKMMDAIFKPSGCPVIPPLKVLISVLGTCLATFANTTTKALHKRPRLTLSGAATPTKLANGTFLPSLGVHLADSWTTQAAVSADAAKADDAQVPTQLWDNRITLVLPLARGLLLGLRQFLFRKWCSRIYRSFRAYLRRTYGDSWQQQAWDKGSMVRSAQKRRRGGEEGVGTKTTESFNLGETSELLLDLAAGRLALQNTLNSSWWAWDSGSSLFFWRWPTLEQQRAARDGIRLCVIGALPNYKVPQRRPKVDVIAAIGKKLNQVRHRGYIQPGSVVSLTAFFPVPKKDDIRIVYDGSVSGLNSSLWCPSFWLPTADSALRLVSYYSFMVDLDLGEFFLNFPLHESMRPYAGVDLTHLHAHLEKASTADRGKFGKLWERWCRLFMGLRPSPYLAVRYFYWAEEFARGNPLDKDNPMRYDRVILNLPGDPLYDPTLPWVMKWNDLVMRIAGDIITYIDDCRASGYNIENAWQVARRLASRLQWLGLQDAPRKRRPSSQVPGAWAGGVFKVGPSSVTKTVTQEKWSKARNMIKELYDSCREVEVPLLPLKTLLKQRGFLVHLAMTFSSMVPFLKGLHLTVDSWRCQRGDDGWKLPERDWRQHLLGLKLEGMSDEELDELLGNDAPERVEIVPRMVGDTLALWHLFSAEVPPEVVMRVSKILIVVFGFGDASLGGFGSSFARDGIRSFGSPQERKDGISFRIGVWLFSEAAESSNNREFTNTVEAIEDEARDGSLNNTELFFFTDNSVVEAALFKGTASTEKLLELVIRFRKLEMKYSLKIHVVHVSGKRMIAQGTDGISRGVLNEGVMAGESMASFIPLHQSALDRHPSLKDWMLTVFDSKLEFLTPWDWFQKGHDIRGWEKGSSIKATTASNGETTKNYSSNVQRETFDCPRLQSGLFVWAPPPAAADVALEELRKARIKRQRSTHVFVCPRLLTPRWMKSLHRTCDVVFTIPPGAECWPTDMFEPLLIGICFPFIRCEPWQLRGTPKMHSMGGKLSKLFSEDPLESRTVLRKFFQSYRLLGTLQRSVVSRMLFFGKPAQISRGHDGAA
jgi:hypothetical protein